MAKLEIEQSDQAKALFALLEEDEKRTVRAVLRRIDQADLMPEQSLLIQLNVIESLQDKLNHGGRVVDIIVDSEAYADDAIAEIGEEVRQSRHIGALMGGIAVCAFILLCISGISLIRGCIADAALMTISASLNLGHVVCFIAILAGCLFFVKGDKKAGYNDPKKARTRTQLVGFLFIVAFIALLAAIFANLPVVLTIPALYLLIASLVFLVLWKLSGRL